MPTTGTRCTLAAATPGNRGFAFGHYTRLREKLLRRQFITVHYIHYRIVSLAVARITICFFAPNRGTVRKIGNQCFAAYDLKKLRVKPIIQRIGQTAGYQPLAHGLRVMAALILLRTKPSSRRTAPPAKPPTPEPNTARCPLRRAPNRHAGCLPRARGGCMKSDNECFTVRR